MCTMDSDSFFTFTKNTLIGDSSIFCEIAKGNAGMFLFERVYVWRAHHEVCYGIDIEENDSSISEDNI